MIKLTDAASFYRELTHQKEAWNWLQTQVSEATLNKFAEKYRSASATITEELNNWEGVIKLARNAGAKFPEVIAAQWALESGWGKHTSGKNNFFGLKGSGSSVGTKEFINNKWVEITAGFIDFPDIQACIQYLVDRWYKDYQSFKGVNRASTRNDCARLLVSERYATDPDYATKLIQIMDQKIGVAPASPGVINERSIVVPYFYQLDNAGGRGSRECFSSSCAMLAAYYGKVSSDDEYNSIRKKYGDTISNTAQLQALRSLGLTARFITNGNTALIENEIRNNRPVAVGWLHHGIISKPTGDGHWSVIRGFTSNHFIHNDPYGEADMINGNYVNTKPKAGQGVKYSRKNWLRRWEVDGPNTGWAILVNK